ncbi:DUF2147 domain-containing protein [Gilvimarinus algae]|uniref:DUF2147 domain-containing protein n=1 Tax=Gilvimarinus algae TaxID=3058037 RepID=A0ABT8TBU4_9GAMM|nr:DUF2147 domain-containing protein [Gilvimarinus sp. SDUM040014]MDO3381390.1 DUF2147 domain-containing protein [Gilvimarinus sp. SDUM040014]
MPSPIYRFAIACMIFSGSLLAKAAPVEGQWMTVDDKDGTKKSIVELRVTEEGSLEGRILTLLQEKSKGKTCEKCPGEFRDKPLEGLRFMWGLTQEETGQWTEGQILDPKSGKVYKAKVSLSDDGQTLTVRGFIGFSLFGRSQVWQRHDAL